MRKKYLSALLFGALLFASAGTFTSCKDYDDDIKNLQGQIDDVNTAITELQNAVQNGKYVTAVSGNGNVITFTFSDGSTTPITIETESGEPSQTVTIGEDGEVIINGEGTGYYTTKTPSEAEVEAGLVKKGANGTWEVLGEDGEYTDTKIPVSGISVSGSEAEGYTFTIVNANGETQTVELPTAASAITSMSLGDKTNNSAAHTILFGNNAFVLTTETFILNGPTGSSNNPLDKASDWKGNKALPANESVIYASPTTIDLRVNPVSVPAQNLKFYLTNTKNQDLNPVELVAVEEAGDLPLSNTNGRAANTGNGLFTLHMENTVVAKNDNGDIYASIVSSQNNGYVYSVNANHAFRSEYKLTIGATSPESLSQITLTQGQTVFTTAHANNSAVETADGGTTLYYKVGIPVQVGAIESSALYDIYLEADKSDCEVYGLTFDQDAHTFTIGKNPDVSTVDASFDLIVYTVANNGAVNKATITVNIDTEISAAAEYQLHTHDVNKKREANHFGIDLTTMKTALGDNLNQWMQNVDLTKFTSTAYALYDNENCTGTPVNKAGITANVVEKLVDNSKSSNTSDRNKTNYIQVNVDNNLIAQLELGKTYYFKASFFNEGGQLLNSIVVPVTFTAPTLAEQFVKEPAVFVDGGNLAMAYMNVRDQLSTTAPATNTGKANYSLKNAFQSMPTDVNVNANVKMSVVNNDKLYDGDYTSADLAQLDGPTLTENMQVSLKGDQTTGNLIMDDGTGRQLGYGQDLTIKATDALFGGVPTNNTGWKYADKDGEYTFQIRIMSPIYEGTVTAIGDVVEIEASDIVNGYKMGNEDIAGTTYNNIPYSVLPDKLGTGTGAGITTADWTREDIKGVSAKSLNTRVVTIGASKTESANAVGAEQDKDNKKVADGHILVFPENIAETSQATVNINVTDIWGYTKTNPITVQVNVGE